MKDEIKWTLICFCVVFSCLFVLSEAHAEWYYDVGIYVKAGDTNGNLSPRMDDAPFFVGAIGYQNESGFFAEFSHTCSIPEGSDSPGINLLGIGHRGDFSWLEKVLK